MQFGSLNNMIDARVKNPEPEVGMGATILAWTDRYGGTVIEVRRSKAGKITAVLVQEDTAVRADKNGMSEHQNYEFAPNPEGQIWEFTMRRNGRLAEKGSRKGQGYGLRIGRREKYYDYSF